MKFLVGSCSRQASLKPSLTEALRCLTEDRHTGGLSVDLLHCSEPVTPGLVVRSSAKSFTAGTVREASIPAPVDIRARERESHAGPNPKDVTYTSINQFQQIVELYRGR